MEALKDLFAAVIDALVALFNCWPMKLAISGVITACTFALGPVTAAVVALFVLTFVDLFTRWLAITTTYMRESSCRYGLPYCFIQCWRNGRLSSQEMRQKFVPKVIAYILLIIAANLLNEVIPPLTYNGKDWGELPRDLTIAYLALTEGMSIVENLIAAGFDALRPLENWLGRKRDGLVGQVTTTPAQPVKQEEQKP